LVFIFVKWALAVIPATIVLIIIWMIVVALILRDLRRGMDDAGNMTSVSASWRVVG
jgi:hypothetical protein